MSDDHLRYNSSALFLESQLSMEDIEASEQRDYRTSEYRGSKRVLELQ